MTPIGRTLEGTGADVLNNFRLGHCENTVMPGQVGNVALAGHRQTNDKVLDLIHTLELRDHLHVRTVSGYYTYTVVEHDVVAPAQTQVVASNPRDPGAVPVKPLLTLTSCHPRYGDTERYVVHAELASWRLSPAGPPAEIASTVAGPAAGE